MTAITYFDGRETGVKGIYNRAVDTVFIDVYLDDKEMKKVTYHELGHKNHTITDYQFNRERCELQADRNMIHHLLKDAIQQLDDVRNFDFLKFMEYYDLNTISDEIMVKEEYNRLIS